jgi:hypothetical protein
MKTFFTKLTVTGFLVILAVLSTACSNVGGADVYIEKVSIGSVSVAGKPVSGLPTQNVNIILKTGANKVVVSQADGKTIIKLQPSAAVITSDNTGISFTGVEPEQVELKWEEIKTK